MSSRKNILSTLKPCYYANFLVGNAPFKFLTKCQIRVIHLKNYYIAFNIIDVVLVVYLLYAQYALISQENLSTLMTTVIITSHSAFSVVHFLQNSIINRSQRFMIMKLCEKLFAIDKQLDDLQIRINYNSLMWKSIRFGTTGFTGMTIYFVFLDRMYNRRITGNYIVYYATIRHAFMSCLFLTCLQIITEFLDKLNENLAKQETSRRLVTKSSRIFADLSEAVKLTNRIYDYQILFSFAMTFVLMTLKLYNIIRIVSLEGEIESNAALSLLIMLSEKLILGYTSYRCMHKVISVICYRYCVIFRSRFVLFCREKSAT
jgi:hypothetical protein